MAKTKHKNNVVNLPARKTVDPQIETILQAYAAAQTTRQSWEGVWQDCYDYALPHRDVFASDAAYNNLDIYDATAADGVDQLAASLLAQLAPPWSRWFALAPGMDVPDNERGEIADKLANVTARIHAHLMQSNFATEIHQCFLDLVVAGTGSILVDEAQPGQLSALQFNAVPLAHVTLAEDPFGRLNTTYRTQRSTGIVLQQRFPQAAELFARLAADNEYQWLEVIVPERSYFQYSAILLDHPNGTQFLAQQRLSHSPFIHARWLKSPGEVYGRSPVMKALPDIKTANKVVELVLKNASIAVTGIWQADDDGVLNPATIQLKPGMIIPKAVGSAGLTPLGAPGKFDVSQLVLTDLRQQIRRALLVDQLGQMIDRNMTATEITQRSDEMSRLIGAIYGRLQAELLTPLILRVVAILARRGEIPDIHIDGRYITLCYQAPLAQAQKLRDAQNVLDWLKMAAGLGPEALAMIDAPATAQYLAEHFGVPENLLHQNISH